jgi:hypothetical protein
MKKKQYHHPGKVRNTCPAPTNVSRRFAQ